MTSFTVKSHDLSKQQLTKPVNKRLCEKYSNSFHFFEVRPINQILNGSYQSKTYIDLNDLRNYIDDTEYLRRLYYYRTLTGRSQIDHRIKLCGQYYSKAVNIAHHYPMMIVTNTKSLFIKRNRRLNKIQAGQGSSDETEQIQEEFVNFDENSSIDILDELKNSSLEDVESKQSNKSSYDSQQLDVFEADIYTEDEKILSINLKNLEQSNLSHLITDLTVLQQLKDDTQSTAPYIQNPALINICNQPILMQNSISITAIPTDKLSSLKEKKKSNLSKYFDLLQSSREYLLTGLTFNLQNAPKDDQKTSQLKESIHKQKATLDDRRKKIRLKAQQLLRRAKNQSQEGINLRQ